MNKPNMICRVCGKEYYCCGDSRKANSWKTMACSEDCFKEYMKRIDEARNSKPVVETVAEVVEEVKTVETPVKMKYGKKKATVEVEKNETEKIIED